MPTDPAKTQLFHITDVTNLPGILQDGRILSDAALQGRAGVPTVIGMPKLKERRMTKLTIPCCGNRFVGEFVPFYYCPRSPMLLTINSGNTGRQPGCQKSILHLVSNVSQAIQLGREWAISDGNAAAFHTGFSDDIAALDDLDWATIRSNSWGGKVHTKHSEFLLADFAPWTAITQIGCMSKEVAKEVEDLVDGLAHQPKVVVKRDWYF